MDKMIEVLEKLKADLLIYPKETNDDEIEALTQVIKDRKAISEAKVPERKEGKIVNVPNAYGEYREILSDKDKGFNECWDKFYPYAGRLLAKIAEQDNTMNDYDKELTRTSKAFYNLQDDSLSQAKTIESLRKINTALSDESVDVKAQMDGEYIPHKATIIAQVERIKVLQACHEAELGVCFQHCDEVKELKAEIAKYMLSSPMEEIKELKEERTLRIKLHEECSIEHRKLQAQVVKLKEMEKITRDYLEKTS